jgi:hypothetical protein
MREEEEKKREKKRRENKMTPPLLQRLCVVCVFEFCSVQTRVETFATQKKRREKKIGIRIELCVSSTYIDLHAWTVAYTPFKIV